MKGSLPENAHAVSLIKGFHSGGDDGFQLLTDLITDSLGVDCSVLMGANIANEIAQGHFCEATLGEYFHPF